MRIRRTSVLVPASAAAVLAAAAGAVAQTIQIVPLTTNRIAFNLVDGNLYATVPSSAGAPTGNSITAINPSTAAVGASVFMGSEPLHIAISDTGRYAYVALDGSGAVRRFDCTTQTAGLEFQVGLSGANTLYADDIEVMPGNEDVIAVARKRVGVSPRGNGVAVYENGVMRTGVAGSSINVLAWSSDPGVIYGFNNETTGFQTYRLGVSAAGASILQTQSGVISGFGTDIEHAGGRVFTTGGRVVNGDSLSIHGTFTSGSAVIEADAANGRFFALATSGSPRLIRVYDITSFLEIGTISVAGVASNAAVSDLVRHGADGLAFRTNTGQVVIVNSPLVAANTEGACCRPDGTCTAETFTVCSAVSGLWSGPETPCASVSCAQPGACCIADGTCNFVLQSACAGVWQGAGVTCAAANCPPPPGGDIVRIVPLMTSRIAWNPSNGNIYATVPPAAGAPRGNSITPISTATATIGDSVPIGNDPLQVAISDNGRYAYVGLNGADAVRRFDCTTHTAGLQFQVGAPGATPLFVDDLQVMPGNDEVVAIARRRVGVSPRGQGVAVYENGAPRTTIAGSSINVIAWSGLPGEIYGFNNETTGFQTYRIGVSESGAAITQTQAGLISGFGTDIEHGGGFIYSHNGAKVHGPTLTSAGTFTGASGVIEPDPHSGRLFVLATSGSPRVIRAYDLNTFLEVGSISIPGVASGSAVSDLIRFGENGLAFRTGAGQVVLVNTSLVVSNATGACCHPDGTCDVSTYAVCDAAAGSWRGPDSTCAAANCPQPGACCASDGSCTFILESLCSGPGGAGGVWAGAGIACAAANCNGACCLGFGVCTSLSADACAAQGGLFWGIASTCAAGLCNLHPEAEPNGTKAEATATTLAHGHGVRGVTTGTSATSNNTALASADYFRLKTAPAAPGIYQHRLTLDSEVAGHSAWVRGRSQTAVSLGVWPCGVGAASATDNAAQTHQLVGTDRLNMWYGFGREEEVYYRVDGSGTTTEPYLAILQTSQITPVDIGPFGAGSITATTTGQGHSNDTHLRIYDADLNPIDGYANDGAHTNGGAPANSTATSFLRRDYDPGTYYLAITIGNLATSSGSPCDDNVRNGPMTDFPNVALDTGNSTITNLAFAITDSAGTTAFPATRGGRGEIAWFRFTVVGGACYANCDESTTPPVLNVADFGCFLTRYAAGEPYANCDESTTPPVLNVADFGCFLTRYAAGCP